MICNRCGQASNDPSSKVFCPKGSGGLAHVYPTTNLYGDITLHAIVEVQFAKLQLVSTSNGPLEPEKYWSDVATVELGKDYELSSALCDVVGDVRAEGRAWACYPRQELSFEARRVVEQDIQSNTRWVTLDELDKAREIVRVENALTSTSLDALRAFARVFADAFGAERVRVLFYSIT